MVIFKSWTELKKKIGKQLKVDQSEEVKIHGMFKKYGLFQREGIPEGLAQNNFLPKQLPENPCWKR